jgi:hypothetical protein
MVCRTGMHGPFEEKEREATESVIGDEEEKRDFRSSCGDG